MATAGYLDILVDDWGVVQPYWERFLLDHPDHPVALDAKRKFSIACTLYSDWCGSEFSVSCWSALSPKPNPRFQAALANCVPR